MVEMYFVTKLPTLVQRQFRRKYPVKKIPHQHTITQLVKNFRDTGSVVNNKNGHSGPKLTVRTPTRIQDVRDQLEVTPQVHQTAVTANKDFQEICATSHSQRFETIPLHCAESSSANPRKQDLTLRFWPEDKRTHRGQS